MQSYPVSPLESDFQESPAGSPYSPPPTIDFSQKRSLDSKENQKSGTAFLSNRKEKSSQPNRKSFFRDVDNDENSKGQISKEFLINSIQSLSTQQCCQIATEMQIFPSTKQMLLTYVESLSPSNLNLINQVLGIVQKQNIQNIKKFETPQEVLFDCRYSLINAPPILTDSPVGQAQVSYSFEIPPLQPGVHIIIQSLSPDAKTRCIYWPKSLVILINNIPIKNRGAYLLPFIDITKYATTGVVNIFCDQESQNYLLSAIQVKYMKYDEIIEEIKTQRVSSDPVDGIPQCLIDPTTGRLIQYPGRGKQCMHSQCFDLKEYLKTANASHQWICPICRMQLPVQNLVFPQTTYQLLCTITGKNIQMMNPMYPNSGNAMK